MLSQPSSKQALGFLPRLATHLLESDRVRPLVFSQLGRRLLAEAQRHADPRRPQPVAPDKLDISRALIRSAGR